MLKIFLSIILIYCLFFFSSLSAVVSIDSDSDIILSQIINMEFHGKNNNYKLKSNIEVQKVYLSERSLKDDYSVISEQHFEKISKLKAYRNGNKLSKKLLTDIYPQREDVFFNSSRLYIITYPFDMEKGDTIKYTYKEEIEDIVFCPVYKIQRDLHTELFEINLTHPKNITVDFDFVFVGDSIPYLIERPNEKQTVLRFKDIPKAEQLPYFEHSKWLAKINIKFYEDGKLLSPATPEAFVDWYKKLTPLRPLLNESEKQTLQDELDTLFSIRDKLRYIHNFVKDNFRYVSDLRPSHTITPFAPSTILGSKFGDCKDRACLVSAIAFEAGIDVSMAVVTASSFIDYKFTHPFLYNHVICYYENESESIFFDPTARYQNFDFVPEYLGECQALILDPENPKTAVIRSTIDSATLEVSIVGHIDSLKNSSVKLILRNQLQAIVRRAANEQTTYEHNNYLNDLLNSYFYMINLKNFKLISSADSAVVYTAQADLSSFVISGKEKKYLPKIPFTLFNKEILTRNNDDLPLHFDRIIKVMLSIDIQFDSIQTVSDSLSLSQVEGVQFSSKSSVTENDRLLVQYQYLRENKIMTGNVKNDFLIFCKEYINSKNKMFIINKAGE